ncbi:MAG TPA: Na+/H+ antiporter NhaA [Acetobacteraceae bacterium]|nr:Na+/H+ antiporter NhaA [Acetobacteraceae bacterium]
MDGPALGLAAGLFLGEITGIFGAAWTAIRAGFADMPAGATWPRMPGVAALCGTGFTNSLFIHVPAFPGSPDLQQQVKLGILAGSLLSGLLGYVLLRFAPGDVPVPGRAEWKARSGHKV